MPGEEMARQRPAVHLIAALAADGGIGIEGRIPWRLRRDFAHFQRLTTEAPEGLCNAVLMGRGVWDSIPPKSRPLPGRLNVVLSRTLSASALAEEPETLLARSYEEALETLADPALRLHAVWNIGGVEVYRAGLAAGAERLYLTHIEGTFPADRFFPDIGPEWSEVSGVAGVPAEPQEEKGLSYRFAVYQRSQHQ